MKTRLIISDRGWAFKVHAKPADGGRYFAYLGDQGGQPVKPGFIVGAFESLDQIVANAPQIYRQLHAHHTSGTNTAAAASGMSPDKSSPTTAPTTAAKKTPAPEAYANDSASFCCGGSS